MTKNVYNKKLESCLKYELNLKSSICYVWGKISYSRWLFAEKS